MVRIQMESLQQVNWTAEIGSKKLIKRQFEYDLKQNLAQGRSNRISLQWAHDDFYRDKFFLPLWKKHDSDWFSMSRTFKHPKIVTLASQNNEPMITSLWPNHKPVLGRWGINIWTCGKSLKGQLLKSYTVKIKTLFFVIYLVC